jgi:hypothetical protein
VRRFTLRLGPCGSRIEAPIRRNSASRSAFCGPLTNYKECAEFYIGDVTARRSVRLVPDKDHARRGIARKEPGVPVGAAVKLSRLRAGRAYGLKTRPRYYDLPAASERDIDRPAPGRIGCLDRLRHVVRRVPAMLAGPECPVAAVSGVVLRPHLAGQLVERLGVDGGVLSPVGRDDRITCLAQSGDDAGGQGVGIARAVSLIVFAIIRSTAALSRSDIPSPRSSALTSGRVRPLPTAGWPGLVNRPICGR